VKTINVKLKSHSYPVVIGKGAFNKLSNLIESKKLHQNLFFVIDKNVEKHFGHSIKNYFNEFNGKKYYYSLDASEKSKSFEELKKVYSVLLEQRFGRDTLLIAIGGGVTGDLAGFAASTFMRGIQIAHVPTTLTACVDSSIGGKTAINFNYYKNIIGSFHHPQFVLCNTNFLHTLPEIEMISGLGEIIKYAFTTNNEFYNFVEKNINSILTYNASVLEKVITDSINYKVSVVTQDEKELSLRKVLNFGHTFAHAIERELKNKIKHGEAVTAGIVCALYLSYKKKLLSKDLLEQYKTLPLKLKLSKSLKTVEPDRIYENMFADKKNRNGQINFVLIRDIGEMVMDVNASKNEIIYAIENSIISLNFG
jgi:3-dehydroquinate synthase